MREVRSYDLACNDDDALRRFGDTVRIERDLQRPWFGHLQSPGLSSFGNGTVSMRLIRHQAERRSAFLRQVLETCQSEIGQVMAVLSLCFAPPE